MADDFQLTITPIKPSDLPTEETIIASANRLIESTTAWQQGKTYHKTVHTCHRSKNPGDGAPWHCRISEHPPTEVSFNQLWSKLGQDKAINEKESESHTSSPWHANLLTYETPPFAYRFIPEIKEVVKLKEVSPTASIWGLYYTFTPPVSPRVFTVLQVCHLDTSNPKRRGMIVSLPIDLSGPDDKKLKALEPEGVRGRYVSVETITELDNGSTEWRMATSSTPGGIIPSFVVESTMDSKIADDVPHFMDWLRKLPQ
ncbi:hypothetical protein H0H92_003971 [Tricholoma furcatifolium]|nr:hypothetical protein H0H92_003971 [Tricholoma furcatifolium]